MWTAPEGRELPHPPPAIVLTKKMGTAAMQNRMREVARLSQPTWRGRWTTGYPHGVPGYGYQDYEGTVPVVVTVLDRLEQYGPHGPVWWRYGQQGLQTLTDALEDPDYHRASAAWEKRRRATADAARERRQEERAEERRRRRHAA
ncbi:hypothetical protein ACFQ7B_33205 [Streptomyces erythrochromogenes]|uniref:hypothetical protein n=1 Tax=Streptomyces erythrochromogenes TaxID=285574 RepID=UPI00367F1791